MGKTNTKDVISILFILCGILFLFFEATALSVILLSAVLAKKIATNDIKMYGILGIICIGAAGAILYKDVWKTIVFSCLMIYLSFMVGFSVMKKFSLYKMLVTVSAGVTIIAGLSIIFCMDMYTTSAVWVVFGKYFSFMKELAAQIPEMGDTFGELIQTLINELDLLLPSVICIGSIIISYVVFQFTRILAEKDGVKINVRHFYELRLNASFTFIFLLLDVIVGAMVDNIIMLNISSVTSFIFIMCGISVIDFYFQLSIPTPVRLLIYASAFIVIAMLGPIGALFINGISFVGMIDSVYPLRRFPKKKR